MPVGEEDMEVEPDHVYVMPPDQNMAFSDGTLKLTPRTQTPGRAMPIDHFFRSVAEDRGSTAIGVILSGTGSDGTLGLAAWNRAQPFSTSFLRGHAVGRCGCEMSAPILDQPFIAVADGHVEEIDRYRGDDRPIRTVNIVQGKQRVGDRDIWFDEADPIVGERRLRGGGYGLLRLGTEVLHHGDSPLQKITHRRHESSIFGE